MSADEFISWLLHSDWYLVGGWILCLAIAVILSFTSVPPKLSRSRSPEPGKPPA